MPCDFQPVLPPFAAVDIGTIITVVIVFFSIVGWLLNFISEKKKQNQSKRNVPAAKGDPMNDDRFQQEIDQFLQQVGGRPKPRRPAMEEVAIEVVPEEEILQRQGEERRNRKLSTLEDRHLQSSNLGEGVRAHVEATMHTDTIAEKVESDVGHRIEAVVEAGFGVSRAKEVPLLTVVRTGVRPQEIVAMLRDPDSVRKAIIVSEILKRPTRR